MWPTNVPNSLFKQITIQTNSYLFEQTVKTLFSDVISGAAHIVIRIHTHVCSAPSSSSCNASSVMDLCITTYRLVRGPCISPAQQPRVRRQGRNIVGNGTGAGVRISDSYRAYKKEKVLGTRSPYPQHKNATNST